RAYSCTEPGQYISTWRAEPGTVVDQMETCMCRRSPKQVIARDQREQDGPRAYSCTDPGQYISPWRAGPGPVVNQTGTCMCRRSHNRSSPEISGNRMDTGHTRARSRVSTSHHGMRDPVPW
ncbi:MAG: hypothetical protein WC382_10555, partial [Methanoregulaceae archaeon]